MEKKIAKVKMDLRSIRKLAHNISAATRAKSNYVERLELLRAQEPSNAVRSEEARIHRLIKGLNIEKLIHTSGELEAIYMPIIDTFDPLDRAIIIDAVVNGKAYWRIGREIGYTERGIQKRMTEMIRRLAENT
ncbi:MAG: hypothetical protein IJX38_01220 [Clostridia bacterium]|nr:hypothetical protein [Clostridia bacterium]